MPNVKEATGIAAAPTKSIGSRLVWGLPAAYTVGWFVYVSVVGHWDRVLGTWRTALTMLFGSFVAGSTPQGGGAVAFPVFTKLLEITGPVARTFSLSIQATGMVMASATILLAGRKVDVRSIMYGTAGGLVGFVFGAYVLSDPNKIWWDSRISGPYIKVAFTIAIASMAYIVFLCFGAGAHGHDGVTGWTNRSRGALLAFGFVGGIASALTGSGVDVFLFLFAVLIAGMHPKVGIPTSIITMAIVSVAGLIVYGIIGGQLSIDLDASGDVIAVGDNILTEPLDGARYDLFGIWLGAMPIVVWGAPLGSWVASVMSDRRLVQFVGGMALAEVASTIIFLEPLHSDRNLITFGVLGLAATLAAVRALSRTKTWVMDGSTFEDHAV